MKRQVESHNKEREKAISKAKIAQSVIDELKGQNKKLSEENRKDYEEQIKDLNMKLQGEKVQNSVHRDVIASMSPQIDKLKCENEAHESNESIMKDKLHAAESELTKKKGEADSMRTRANALERKLEESKELAQCLQKSQILPSELDDLKQKLEAKIAESDNLAVDLIEITDKCSEMEKDFENVNTKLKQFEIRNRDLQKECDNYQSQTQENSREAKAMHDRFCTKVIECEKLEGNVLSLTSQVDDLRERIDSMRAEQESINVTGITQSNINLDSQVQKLRKEKDETSNQLEDAHRVIKSLSNKLHQTEQHTSAVISDLTAQAHNLQGRVKELQSADRKCTDSDAQVLSELQALVIEAAHDLQHLEQEKAALLERLDQCQAKIASQDKLSNKHLKDVHMASEKHSELQKTNDSLKSQIANLDVELSHSTRNSEKTIESLKQKIYSLTQDKTALQNRNDTLVIEVDKILSEKQVYIDEIEKLASELKSAKTSATTADARSKEMVEKLTSQLQNSEKNLEEKTDTARDLYVTSETQLQARIDETSALNSKLNIELDSLSLQLSEVEQERDALLEIQTGNGDVYQELAEHKEQRQRLSQVLKSTEMANRKLEAQFSESDAKRKTLASQDVVLRKEATDLRQTIEEERNKSIYLANKQADKYQVEIDTLKDTLEDLTRERDELKKQSSSRKTGDTETPSVIPQIDNPEAEYNQLRIDYSMLQNEHLDQLSSASAETCILQAQLENMGEIVNRLNAELKLKENIQALSSELQNRLRDEKKSHATTAAELNSIKTEQMSFKEQVQDLKEKYEHSEHRCEELHRDIKSMEDDMQQQSIENENLSKQLVSLQITSEKQSTQAIEVAQVQKLLEEAVHSHEKVSKQNLELGANLNKEGQKVKDLTDRLISAQQELSNISSRNDDELANLRAQLESQKAVCTLAKAASSLRAVEAESVSETTESGDDLTYIETLQREIEMLTDQAEFLKKENDDLSGRVTDLYEQLSETSISVQNIDMLRSQHTQSLEERDSLKEQLAASGKRIDELTNHLNTMESKRHSLEDELDSLKARSVSLFSNFGRNEISPGDDGDTSVASNFEQEIQDLKELGAAKDEAIAQLKSANIRYETDIDKSNVTIKEREQQCASLKAQVDQLQEQLALLQNSILNFDTVDWKLKYEQQQLSFENIETEKRSLEQQFQQTMIVNTELVGQVKVLKEERDRLMTQSRASPRMDENNSDAVEYRSLQRQIIDLKQQLQAQKRRCESVEEIKSDYMRQLDVEKAATDESAAEVQKLEMSISMLMTSHQTEMSSLQSALKSARSSMEELESRVKHHSSHSDSLQVGIASITSELNDLRSSKETVVCMVNELVLSNNAASSDLQEKLNNLIIQQESLHDASLGETTSNLSVTLPLDPTHHSSMHDTSPQSQYLLYTAQDSMSSVSTALRKPESLATVSHYGNLSKTDLVAKLSDQTKHELILRKTLDEARQSLAFYRAAIDNIIDCLGTALPGVKKWASEFLKVP